MHTILPSQDMRPSNWLTHISLSVPHYDYAITRSHNHQSIINTPPNLSSKVNHYYSTTEMLQQHAQDVRDDVSAGMPDSYKKKSNTSCSKCIQRYMCCVHNIVGSENKSQHFAVLGCSKTGWSKMTCILPVAFLRAEVWLHVIRFFSSILHSIKSFCFTVLVRKC